MENTIKFAFASQRSVPNIRLTDLITRVETKYCIRPTELGDDQLGLVSAAGEPNIPLSNKENEDA